MEVRRKAEDCSLWSVLTRLLAFRMLKTGQLWVESGLGSAMAGARLGRGWRPSPLPPCLMSRSAGWVLRRSLGSCAAWPGNSWCQCGVVPSSLTAAGPPAGLTICQEQRAVTCRGPLRSPWCWIWSPFQSIFFGAGWNDASAGFISMIRNQSEETFELRKGMNGGTDNPSQSCNLYKFIIYLFIFNTHDFLLKYSWFTRFQVYSKMTHVYICIYIYITCIYEKNFRFFSIRGYYKISNGVSCAI